MSSTVIDKIRQYLTFRLEEEIFGVDVAQVREILDYIKVTKVPRMPDFMCGVINLRGSVVPVVDMRIKFGMNKVEATVDTCIIVVDVNLEGEATTLGALVDSVQEVFELEPAEIEAAPRLGTKLRTEFIKGMGKRNEMFIILLDIDKIFSSEELEIINESSDTIKN